jgi:FkbM family methyltransferase
MPDHFPTESTAPLGVLLHIGAGSCSELDGYLAADFEHIVLVEPNPEVVAELDRKAAKHPSVMVLPAAVSAASGEAFLNVFNARDMSSLRVPTGLKTLFPGLRMVAQPKVDVVDLSEVLRRIPALTADKSNFLVVDAPGEEQIILTAFADMGDLSLFQQIKVHAGRDAYYEDGATAAQALSLLTKTGYLLVSEVIGKDPDWPAFMLQLDPIALENIGLKAQISRLDGTLASLKIDLETGKSSYDALVKAHASELATEQQVSSDLRQALMSAQAAEDALVKAHASELATEQQVSSDLRQALMSAQAAEDALVKAHASELATEQQVSSDLRQALMSAQAAEDALVKTLQKDLGITLRLQTLARMDHKELQGRFEELQQEKAALEELLSKLAQKLGSAVGYLKELSADSEHGTTKVTSAMVTSVRPSKAKSASRLKRPLTK